MDTLAPKGDEGRGKLRKAAVRGTHPFNPQMSEWGNPPVLLVLQTEFIGLQSIRREVKHLSTSRKINQFRDSPSSGERTGNSLNLLHVKAPKRCAVGVAGLTEPVWNGSKSYKILH